MSLPVFKTGAAPEGAGWVRFLPPPLTWRDAIHVLVAEESAIEVLANFLAAAVSSDLIGLGDRRQRWKPTGRRKLDTQTENPVWMRGRRDEDRTRVPVRSLQDHDVAIAD